MGLLPQSLQRVNTREDTFNCKVISAEPQDVLRFYLLLFAQQMANILAILPPESILLGMLSAST